MCSGDTVFFLSTAELMTIGERGAKNFSERVAGIYLFGFVSFPQMLMQVSGYMDNCRRNELEFAIEPTENEAPCVRGSGDRNVLSSKSSRFWSITNADVPFSRLILPQTNFSILIEGCILQQSNGFTINLSSVSQCKSLPNIVFHFNPRCDQQYVARNSRLDNLWGDEESVSGQRFPFCVEEPFFLEIFFADREFLIAVNGFHFCSYQYRLPVSSIKLIEILGGLSLQLVETFPSKSYPYLPPSNYLLKMFKLTPVSTVDLNSNNRKILEPPVMAELTESFRPGYTVRISGKVKMLPHSFTINFQNGKTFWPRPLINLHINARFNYSEKVEHAVVLNSWLHESWGQEQVPGFCPFFPGENFDLSIFCARDAFEIIVNNELLAVYKYRAVLGLIDTIYIFGDIMIDEIRSSLEIPQPSIPNR